MLARLSPGVMPVPGRGLARFQPFFAGDLARIVVACLDRPDTIGRTFELGGPRYWTYREITAEVLAALGKQRVIVPMPVSLISLVAGVSETLRLPFPVGDRPAPASSGSTTSARSTWSAGDSGIRAAANETPGTATCVAGVRDPNPPQPGETKPRHAPPCTC